MAIEITCECGKRLTVNDEFAGQRQQCPNCQEWLTLPMQPNSKTERPSVADRKSRMAEVMDGRLALVRSNVSLGISWIYVGYLMSVYVGTQEKVFATNVLQFFTILASVVTIVGKLMCLTAPSQVEGKEWIRLAVLVDGLAAFLSVAGPFMPLPPLVPRTALALTIGLLLALSNVCVVLFLRHLGEFLGQRNITEKASGLLKILRILLIAVLILVLLTLVNAQPLVAIGLIALLISMIVVTVLYLNLLSTCRNALSKDK